MNKKILAVFVFGVFAVGALPQMLFAYDPNEAGQIRTDNRDYDQMAIRGKGISMMKMMMEKSVVATTDGGVVIVTGNKIIKYDSELNVVKEVELKMDIEAMHKDMAEMMKNCPVMAKTDESPMMTRTDESPKMVKIGN